MATLTRQLTRQAYSAQRSQRWWGYLFVLPALIMVGVFFILPLAMTFWMSLHDWPLLGQSEFTGLENYEVMFDDDQFWTSMKFTTEYTLLVTPAIFIPAFGLALLVNQGLRGVGIFRTIYFMPFVVGLSAVCLLWNWLLNDQVGVFNTVLREIGVIDGPKLWFAGYDSSMTVIIIMVVWKTTGFTMVLFVVGMQAIPKDLYEAAMVDGAGYWRQLRYVTMPLLRRTFALALVLSVIGSFLAFEPFKIMTGGRPQNQTISIVYWIYNNAFVYFKLGYAATLSIALLAVLAALNSVLLYLLRGGVEY